jgi:haloalkane dehalogenase
MAFDRTLFSDLYPFESHTLEVRGGHNLHYLDEGKGEPIVFVHGNPTWSFFWRDLVKELRGSYRCIALDHIGCGLSDKPLDADYEYTLERRIEDLTALLEKLVPKEKVTLVLHDWGGMIGLGWATRHVERVARLVLMNTSGFRLPATKPLPFTLKLIRGVPGFGPLSVRGMNAFAAMATKMAAMRPMQPRVAAAFTAPYDSWRNRIATLRFVQDIPMRPGDRSWDAVMGVESRLEALAHLPILIGWGEKDFVFDDHFLREWRRRFPAAEVHAYPDAGHYVLEDAGERLIPVVRDFLARPALVAK